MKHPAPARALLAVAACGLIGLGAIAPAEAAKRRPDLVVASVSVPTGQVVPGTGISVHDKTKNRGKAKAKPSTTRFYLSSDDVHSNNDLLLAPGRAVKALRPRKSQSGSTDVTVPSSAPLGSYRLLGCADDKHKVREKNEGNNCRAAPGSIELIACLTNCGSAAIPRFLDPPRAYNGIETPARLYVTGLTGTPTGIDIFPSGSPADTTPLPVGAVSGDVVTTQIPPALAPGPYDLIVRTGEGDTTVLDGALNLLDSTTVGIDQINPPFGSTLSDTPITITGGAFSGGARAYLAPAGGLAVDIGGATVDPGTLTATVPSGLATGTYDLVVVNPDGSVGVAGSVFTVLGSTPTITDAAPTSFTPAGGQFTITGTGFSSPLVSLSCRDAAGTPAFGPAVSTGSSSATSVTAMIDNTGLSGTVCIARLNNDNGAYADYGPITIQNAGTPTTLTPSAAMTTARRNLAVAGGRRTATSGRVYSIGGSDGASALDTVESAPIDAFGGLGSWRSESTLPGPRNLAGAVRIGRFVYVVGGDDGTGPVADVKRAQILDSSDAPQITSVRADFGGAPSGLAPGSYFYQVAALFQNTDPSNPNGQSAAGDPVAVEIPPNAHGVEITWDPVPGAVGYRIYRSPSANDLAGSPRRIADFFGVGATFTDTGFPASVTAPLADGALGKWAQVGTLATARSAPTVLTAPDPSAPSVDYIYALGGRDGTPAVRNDFEYIAVTTQPDGSQSVAAPAAGTGSLAAARSHAPGWAVGHAEAANVPAGTHYLYVGPGETAAAAVVGNTDAALVPAGGDLASFTAQNNPPATRDRGSPVVTNGSLFLLGGFASGAPTNGISITTVTASPPTLGNWNFAGTSLADARSDAAAYQYGPIAFLIGGVVSGAPSTTVVRLAD